MADDHAGDSSRDIAGTAGGADGRVWDRGGSACGSGIGAADCVRECGESALGAGVCKAEGDCHPAFGWGEPLADRPATPDREVGDFISWWDAWVGGGVLVGR